MPQIRRRSVWAALLPVIALWLPTTMMGAAMSLVLAPGVTGTFADPVQVAAQAWRVELQIHDFAFPSTNTLTAKVAVMDGAGLYVALNQNQLWVLDNRDSSQCILSLTGRTNALLRVQRDYVSLLFRCEVWNYDGSSYAVTTDILRNPRATTFGGGQLGSALTTARLAWLRMFDTLLTDGSKPQATAQGNLLNLKFESNTLDTSGLGRNATVTGATYQPTPNQPVPSAPKTDFFLQ